MTESTAVPPPRRRRSVVRRIIKGGVIAASLVVIGVLLLPTILSMDWARERLERELSTSLGTDVKIGSYAFGWFSGLEVEGVSVANPAGFPTDVRLFELRSMRGDASIVSAARGRFEVSGVIDGLVLRVRQRADGTTNLQELLGARTTTRVDTEPQGEGPDTVDLADLRLDLELRDSFIEVFHEEKGVLERLDNVHARISKEFDTQVATVEFASDLHRPGSEQTGRLELKVDAQADPGAPIDVHLNCLGLDLARYRPILDTFLADDQLTAFAGVIAANARITGVPTEELTVEGTIEIEAPHLAGPLLKGMDLRAPRWTIRPNVTAAIPTEGEAPRLDASKFEADLGFLKLRGLPAVAGAPPALDLGFELDVAQLADAGGPIPELLRGTGTRVKGTLSAPLRADFADLTPADLLAEVAVHAAVAVGQLEYASQSVKDLAADVDLAGGKLSIATTAGRFNGGALTLRAEVDATDLEQPPVRVTLGVEDATVGSSAIGALQYAVPLFAGLASAATKGGPVELQSRGGLEMELSGTAFPRAGQPILAWLDDWSGRGKLGLQDGAFRPASAMSGLLELTGERGRLSFKDLSTDFRIAEGFVETGLMKLSAKGREYGITGRTSLSGDIDYVLDARDLLRSHRDGQKILEYLGDVPFGAKLVGTLDAPSLAMPDLGKLAQDAARAAIEKEGNELIEKEAGDLLEKLLGPRKKKDGGKGASESVEDQARDAIEKEATKAVQGLLRGVFGKPPTPPAKPKKVDPKRTDPKKK